MFWLAQAFGLVGLLFTVTGLQHDNPRFLLKCLIGASSMYAAQYFCLGATTGGIIALMAAIRAIVFAHYRDRRIPIMWLVIFLLAIVVSAIVTYDGWLSILPTLSALLYATAVWNKNMQLIRYADVVSCLIYIVYNILVAAYVNLAATIIEMVASLVAIYRFSARRRQ